MSFVHLCYMFTIHDFLFLYLLFLFLVLSIGTLQLLSWKVLQDANPLLRNQRARGISAVSWPLLRCYGWGNSQLSPFTAQSFCTAYFCLLKFSLESLLSRSRAVGLQHIVLIFLLSSDFWEALVSWCIRLEIQPGHCPLVVTLARHFTLTVPLSTQDYTAVSRNVVQKTRQCQKVA